MLGRNKKGLEDLNVKIQGASTLGVKLVDPLPSIGGGTVDYNKLKNKPSINGVTLSGAMTSASLYIVSENTEEGWARNPLYIPKSGEICLYRDINKVKIGDGSVPIVDLPFINDVDIDQIRRDLEDHIRNTEVHVTQEEKQFWNDKLNYSVDEETLILTRS